MSCSKRKRQASPEVPERTRSELWFEEGTIVLQAENVQFKVHRDILSKHSLVFKDMLSLTQHSSADGPLVDGCAVVDLHDSAQDVEYMLRELYSLRSVLSYIISLLWSYKQITILIFVCHDPQAS